ncbi:GNAT family N-acetyltransferase [Paenibacillus sp.]|uniref:GNAT family N-acetyltransferase n=1 Tax=Paenibacillus sp. TaxID=58172 RepID=UPI002D36ED8D|nr:GNAT family N-acetyltransferase [Paenibacillus sp.]HZG55145.1 GNAT family N-acetyltransferase [Paenibacillus sp.]
MSGIELRRLVDVPLADAVDAWNDGFSDYYVRLPMTAAAFAATKFGNEGVSPELSFVAYADGRPAGLLLTAMRTIGGERLAWNAGTCVHPDRRGSGIGAALLSRAVETYREQRADAAYLEAFVQNEGAIRLYRRFGYEPFDTVYGMEAKRGVDWGGAFDAGPADAGSAVESRPVSAAAALERRYSPVPTPWQTRWPSAKGGEALIASRADGEPFGYALFRRSASATTLLQCAADPALPSDDAEAVLRRLLGRVFEPAEGEASDVRRRVFAAPASQPSLRAALAAAGFEETYALTHMRLRLS